MSKLFYWSIISSLAGFLFGFDMAVISGVESVIERLWNLSELELGMAAIGSAAVGTILGAVFGAWPTEKFGRKKTLVWIGALYLVSAAGTGLAPEVYTFSIARFLGGLGIGISTVAAPLYISEISPPERRGQLAGMFQFNIVFGILIAYFSNWAFGAWGNPETAWRWMIGIVALPSLIYTVMALAIPESPRWLINNRRDRAAGMEVLKMISPQASQVEIEAAADGIAAAAAGKTSKSGFWSVRMSRPIILVFLIAFFNQLSGINAVIFFAPRIFEMGGMAANSALLSSVGIGVTNLIFTFIGLWLIDRAGRRVLMFAGSFGYIVSLAGLAWALGGQETTLVPVFVFLFIAAHAVGQGTVIWVFISEIFPNEHRAMGQSLGGATHWVFAALVGTFFPYAAAKFSGQHIFLFFAFMMFLQLLWVKFMMPETKGVALEDMETTLMRH